VQTKRQAVKSINFKMYNGQIFALQGTKELIELKIHGGIISLPIQKKTCAAHRKSPT